MPVVADTGLKELEQMVKVAPKLRRSTGRMRRLEVTGDYLEYLQPYKRGIGHLRLVSDCSNGAAAYRFGRPLGQ